jgi:LPS-assembly protein
MLNLFRWCTSLSFVLWAASAFAQPPQPPQPAAPAPPPKPGADTTVSDSREGSNNQKDWHFIGHVEMDQGSDTKIYADDVRLYTGENRALATGNVVFAQGDNRISAEHAEFDTETKLGTFYNATGFSTVKPPKPQPPRAGVMTPPPVVGQETVVIFFGEKIEKIGPKKFRITNGGFSTCSQPTPRWDLHAGTVVLNVDHYTTLTNAILRVKGVPMFYTPYLYYPTKREDRATGILIPTYGASSLRGQTLHNAFFWAIDRSQDATFLYDYYSKTGQGFGSEYRYNAGTGDGNIRAYLDDQHGASYTDDLGNTTTTSAARSYEIRGGLNQQLPFNMRARANVNYFSSIETSQQFNTNIYDASRNMRSFGGNLVGAWGKYSLNATFDHSEYFYNLTDSTLSGSWPRVAFARNERPIGDSPVYFSLNTEFLSSLSTRNQGITDANNNTVITSTDNGLSRVDLAPQVRFPFKKWAWFTVNSTVGWRETYYTRSYAPTNDPNVLPSVVIDTGLNRTLYTLQAQVVGPVFNRVWDTPENGYAEKFKHSIEPVLTINRTSNVENINEIVKLDGVDNFIGGTTLTYGLNNRFYAKRKTTPGGPAVSREIFDVELSQSYYTNQNAAQYDTQYQTTLGVVSQTPTNFSPIALNFRALPTDFLNANLRAEFDARYHSLRTISAQGSYIWTNRIQVTGGWSKRGYIPEIPAFNDCRTVQTPFACTPASLDQAINVMTNLHTKDNKVGATISFNYDILRGYMQQEQMSLFYNAQCCGIAIQYQTYNYGPYSSSPIPADHRFFLSFTLAGLGNFSPFNGALSGVPH